MEKHSLERLFRALADSTRLRLINLMAEKEICVCYLVEVIDAPQPKISRHLAYLRKAGIVAARGVEGTCEGCRDAIEGGAGSDDRP